MSINQRLNFLMDKQGTTQTELARVIGVSQSVVSQYLSGNKMPGEETINKIVEMYKIDADWLKSGREQLAPTGWKEYLVKTGLTRDELLKEVERLNHELEKRNIKIEHLNREIELLNRLTNGK